MKQLIRESLPKQIADAIEKNIADGVYKVGDKLPTEPQLVDMFGASRNTVREAIQSLTYSGLVETVHGSGTYVIAKGRFQADFFSIMNASEYQNILEIRNMLENQIITSAVSNRTDDDIREMEKYLELRRQDQGSIKESTEADLNFHISIAAATHNDILLNMYRYVSEYIQKFIFNKIYDPESNQNESDRLHECLFEAVRDRDLAKAKESINRIIEI